MLRMIKSAKGAEFGARGDALAATRTFVAKCGLKVRKAVELVVASQEPGGFTHPQMSDK
jgi:hypothetical protein